MNFKYNWDDNLGPILYITIKDRTVGFCFCHRKKDRSIRFFGLEHYLCARCLGIWLGAISAILLSLIYSIPVLVTIIMMVPMIIDGSLQLVNIKNSNNFLRVVTGFLFGLGLTGLLIYLIRMVIIYIS